MKKNILFWIMVLLVTATIFNTRSHLEREKKKQENTLPTSPTK